MPVVSEKSFVHGRCVGPFTICLLSSFAHFSNSVQQRPFHRLSNAENFSESPKRSLKNHFNSCKNTSNEEVYLLVRRCEKCLKKMGFRCKHDGRIISPATQELWDSSVFDHQQKKKRHLYCLMNG